VIVNKGLLNSLGKYLSTMIASVNMLSLPE
jgi:hypothetical protein